MMSAWLILFCLFHSSRVLSGVYLVGGNPTMNTSRLRREGMIASSPSLFLLVVVLLFIIFVCDSASELERWALIPFGGFPALTCFLFF